jgi:hypothetical protein
MRNASLFDQQLQKKHDDLHAAHAHTVGLGASCEDEDPPNASDQRRDTSAVRFQPAPSGYRAATEHRALKQTDFSPDEIPGYDPYGQPVSGYALALKLRKLNQDAPLVDAAPAAPAMLRDAHNIPNGYATALAARRHA